MARTALSPPQDGHPAVAGVRSGPPRRLGWLLAVGWLAVLVVAAVRCLAVWRRPPGERFADLHVYAGSVRMLLDGGSLYDFVADNGAPFTYPPFAGILFAPLGALPEPPLRPVWTGATLIVVVCIAILVARQPAQRVVVALVLLISAPVWSNLRFGQVSVFLVAAVLVDALRVLPPRYTGIATGVAAAVKLTPLIFIPYWWLAGQRRTALTATATFVGCTVLTWAVLPGESVRFWLTELLDVGRFGDISIGGNQSLNGALLRWHLPDSTRTAVLATLGFAVVLIALLRAVRAGRNGHPLTGVVVIAAAGLVISPVSWTHHQVWLVLAALLPVARRAWVNQLWAAFVVAVMVVPIGADLPVAALSGNVRLWLAVAVAAVVPFVVAPAPRHGGVPAPESEHGARHGIGCPT